MDVRLALTDLTEMHPQLLWSDLAAAATSILVKPRSSPLVELPFEFQSVPGFGSTEVVLGIDCSDVELRDVERLRRTYEQTRLVELAAIAVAGLALYHESGHEIVDVSLRGSSADYLVDESHRLLEVAGRSRRSDFESAWQQKRSRLEARGQQDFYICVVEFETPFGRLGYTGAE